MHLLGAEVVPVSSGSRTLKVGSTEAIRGLGERTCERRTTSSDRFSGRIRIRDRPRFQSVIGREALAQLESESGNCLTSLPRGRRGLERDGHFSRDAET